MEAISTAFTQHFYATFDSNRAALASLYGPDSMMTYEDRSVTGAANIIDLLSVRCYGWGGGVAGVWP